MQEMDPLPDRALGEEIQLRVKSLKDGIRFPRGKVVDIHNKMLLLMEIGKARIDTVHTHREDAEVEMIRE